MDRWTRRVPKTDVDTTTAKPQSARRVHAPAAPLADDHGLFQVLDEPAVLVVPDLVEVVGEVPLFL